MNFSRFYLIPISGYQYLSKMLPSSCRYYPSCSEYAKWQFLFNPPHKAILYSTLRIGRCNQLFLGGIDYPLVSYKPPKRLQLIDIKRFCGKMIIVYWLVPHTQNNRFYAIKDFDATTITAPLAS